jgi:hypothetical protein
MGRVPAVPKTTLWLLLLLAPGLLAQAKPSAREALAGTWYLDRSQSDSINVLMVSALQAFGGGGGALVPRDVVLVPRDSVRNIVGTTQADIDNYNARSAARTPFDHRLDVLRQEIFPGDSISLEFTDSTVRVMTALGIDATWQTDGKNRVEAQMDGTMIGTQALWKGKSLRLSRAVVRYGRLDRDFSIAKDGVTLEVKENLVPDNGFRLGGFPKTLVFVRTKPPTP